MVLWMGHPAVAWGQLPLGSHAQGAPQGWAHHSLEPGWGQRPGLVPVSRPQLSQAKMVEKGMKYYLPGT